MTLRTAARIALPLYVGAIYATLGVARSVTNVLRDGGHLRQMVVVAFALTGVAAAVAVLRDPLNRSLRVVLALAGSGVLYAAVVLPMESPEEKLHFIEYGLVALLAFAAAPGRLLRGRRYAFAAAFTLCAGWVDEGIQGLLPSRHYDLRDVGFNLTAGLMALFVLALIRWLRAGAARADTDAAPAMPALLRASEGASAEEPRDR